jgi:hypothetical protein
LLNPDLKLVRQAASTPIPDCFTCGIPAAISDLVRQLLADFVAEVGEEIAGLPSVQSVCRSLRLERSHDGATDEQDRKKSDP